METNVFSTLEFSQPFIKKMVENKKGKVVFISSISGLETASFLGPYNASKHALEAIIQTTRYELHEFGVKVASINPGPFDTGFKDRAYECYKLWHKDEDYFTSQKTIDEAGKMLLDNQFHPQPMIDVMIDLISKDVHPLRNIFPPEMIEKCKDYQNRQYELNCDEKDPSKEK